MPQESTIAELPPGDGLDGGGVYRPVRGPGGRAELPPVLYATEVSTELLRLQARVHALEAQVTELRLLGHPGVPVRSELPPFLSDRFSGGELRGPDYGTSLEDIMKVLQQILGSLQPPNRAEIPR
jgi:hypothetical protein